MESDDDFDSFSFNNTEPSPSPKHRRLKRLKKSTDVTVQSTTVESVNKLTELPPVDFARLEALESSDIRAFDDDNHDDGLIEPPSERFDGIGNGNCAGNGSGSGDGDGNGDEKELSPRFDDGDGEGDDLKVKELRSCYDVAKEDLQTEEVADDDDVEKELGNCDGDAVVRTDRKETKRQLDFDDDDDVGTEIRADEKKEGEEDVDMEVRGDDAKEGDEKEGDEDVKNEKKGKKKRRKSSGDDDEPKVKASYTSKRREEKERRAHLDQLHVESQRILRETRGVSFKPVPPVQKPISSILERIRQRKLEVSKKFFQSNTNDSHKEDDEHVVIDHPKSVETETSDLPESVKEEKVSNVANVDPVSDDVGLDELDVCGEQKGDVNTCLQKELDVESTPALRAPVDDTQELFGDSQTSDAKESENDESSESDSSSQEEEMGPSLLTMKLKFDSAPDDICDEEENDKENVDPHGQEHSSPRGDPAKAFVDDEAEEEDDSDNDHMVFGDDEEAEEEDDIEELNKMIATGYKERPIDLEARNELHQKWLEEKDDAGTDAILRRFNVDSKLREASLLDEEDVEMNDNDSDDDNDDDDENENENDVDEAVERPRVRINAKKAKEMIAQMFTDKDDEYVSSDDEETEKMLVRERLLNKDKEKVRFVSLIEDEDSREVFGLIKKVNTVPEGRKKATASSFFDTMLTGGNSNSSSRSSFLSRMSKNSVPVSSKQGGSSGVRSFIFGRDDSNSRSSLSVSEDMPDTTTSSEMQTKRVTVKYKSSQSQGGSSTQTTNLVSESSSTSFFEILKRSSAQPNVHKHDHKVELSQSVFDAFKIPKKPIKIQGRV
ncbi:hypothetical protein HanXRQr2_Chr04g0154381 [Helianthus annuus]|uniref:Uncharacterized protein n=1 Tax=Helianthus annuus TaxID=4232 RepID=A0A251V011_HELAN|nr:protein starmaker [Helianthus annuus]KAF5809205.1 hypothetical protein HanXRQr2_Chr04g0154381 [Helianthus annuus]KAJ0760576.1 hypothetical protein HanOQP8_Chr04g0139551 [Helianthus annuus]